MLISGTSAQTVEQPQVPLFVLDSHPCTLRVVSWNFIFFPTGETSELFSVDRKTGWIRSSSALTSAESVLHLQIVATDTGSPPLSRGASVTIILRDLAGQSSFSYHKNFSVVLVHFTRAWLSRQQRVKMADVLTEVSLFLPFCIVMGSSEKWKLLCALHGELKKVRKTNIYLARVWSQVSRNC